MKNKGKINTKLYIITALVLLIIIGVIKLLKELGVLSLGRWFDYVFFAVLFSVNIFTIIRSLISISKTKNENATQKEGLHAGKAGGRRDPPLRDK